MKVRCTVTTTQYADPSTCNHAMTSRYCKRRSIATTKSSKNRYQAIPRIQVCVETFCVSLYVSSLHRRTSTPHQQLFLVYCLGSMSCANCVSWYPTHPRCSAIYPAISAAADLSRCQKNRCRKLRYCNCWGSAYCAVSCHCGGVMSDPQNENHLLSNVCVDHVNCLATRVAENVVDLVSLAIPPLAEAAVPSRNKHYRVYRDVF